MDNNQLWQSALGELELILSKANFMTWFKNTFITSHENDRIIIGVPNTFTKAWFEKKYHLVILKALQKITENKIKEVLYKVETSKIQNNLNQPTMIITGIDKKVDTGPMAIESINKPNINEVGLNTRYSFDNFVIGKGNEFAHAACIAVADKQEKTYNPLFIYGGVGLGKTHLLQAIGNRALDQTPNKRVVYVSCEKFTNDFIKAISTNNINRFKDNYRSADILLIDDIQFLTGKEGTQEEFFHTFNALHQNNRQIVISSDRPPKAIPGIENRLISRFEWGMIADISTPDLETRIAILDSKCKERMFDLEKEILNYVAANIQNNIRELEGALNRIIAYSQLNCQVPTLESVKKIIEFYSAGPQRRSLTPKQIINTVASYYDLTIEDVLGGCRKKNLALPRQIIMYLMRKEIKSSYPSIGQEIGDRDHTTAIHAYLKISRVIDEDEKLRQDINFIKQRLYNC